MLQLTVRLHGSLARYGPGGSTCSVKLTPGATLLDLQDLLHIPRGEVGLFVVDGELRHEGVAPSEGVHVDLYPMFGGG